MDTGSIPVAVWSVVAIGISAFQIGFGIVAGRWLMARRVAARDAKAAEAQRTFETATARVNDQVALHAERVDAIQHELEQATGSNDEEYGKMVAGAATRLMEANEQLKAELASVRRELEQQVEQVESQRREARTDALTTLLNRRAFDEELLHRFERWRGEREGGVLLLADIDHFKQFNDKYGHPVGDKVLRHVARVIRESIRGLDVLAARYGGEEFAIILPSASMQMARRVGEEIRTAVEAATLRDGELALQVTMSLGLAQATYGDTPEKLIERADQALYTSKGTGRNCGHYHDGNKCFPIVLPRVELIASVPTEGETPTSEPIASQPLANEPVAVPAEIMPVEVETEEAADRRRRKRLAYRRTQFVAPYSGQGKPDLQAFRQVQVRDISQTGFSFFAREAPETPFLVAALGDAPKITYLTAEVAHTTQISTGDTSAFLVGCRFTGRVETDPTPAESELIGA
jgi:diguanylate cyclase